MPDTLWFSTVIGGASALLYLYVGAVVRGRSVGGDARLANGMFALWWQSLGAIGLLGVILNLVYLLGDLPTWVHAGYQSFVLLTIFAALWGLQFYLVYVYTGSRRSFVPMGIVYAGLYFVAACYLAYLGPPTALTDNGWIIERVPQPDYAVGVDVVLVLLVLGPQMAAAVAYGRLYRKTQDPLQRYRIALVTSSILVWFGSSVVAAAANATEFSWWQVASRVIGLLAAVAVLAAFKPPAAVRRRLGLATG